MSTQPATSTIKLTDAQAKALRHAYVAAMNGRAVRLDGTESQPAKKLAALGLIKEPAVWGYAMWEITETGKQEAINRSGLIWWDQLIAAYIRFEKEAPARAEKQSLKERFAPDIDGVEITQEELKTGNTFEAKLATGIRVRFFYGSWNGRADYYFIDIPEFEVHPDEKSFTTAEIIRDLQNAEILKAKFEAAK